MDLSTNKEVAHEYLPYFRAYKDRRVERFFGSDRINPEHYVPIAYEDSWAALKWVASHCNGEGPKAWLNNYADFH
ncbi:hypothetical protein Pint_33771 [Pistacia integerrima]|uniref:Uncharacterized protein n=1 Tax=Pistacia integerrima TaxID=434235 RepID=A0ACC0X6N7_9ROSI|nr:hypothetical protein Pint_33771 [Pistacia integerrima]